MTTARQTKAQKEQSKAESVERLRALLPVGSTVYTSIHKVAPSGMSRIINLHCIASVTRSRRAGTDADDKPIWVEEERPEVLWITAHVAAALDLKRTEDPEGVRVQGCGMDMGFATVYDLATVLHGDGYSLEQKWL
jgi:hypothetical protein